MKYVDGVRVVRQGDFDWLLLSDEPFSYANPDHAAHADAATKAVGLFALHARFPRPKG